ncbi:integrase catalytic domain-containing protein [Solemya velum gill symbiont]|uniref:DDE-type integrase/transposase/recombinase n=1 Tax=Solemya velum gill symbiont TaxID=2340 RepID=UPI001181FBF1
MADWKNYLNSIYFDPGHPASFSGPDKLYHTVKTEGRYHIGKDRVRKWLQDQETYSLTRGARRRFPRSRVIVEGLDSQWDSDIFSRKLWCRPVKNKTGVEVAKALRSIFEEGRQPKYTLRSDKGREFVNNEVGKLLRERGIHHIVSHNETKANYAERIHRTLSKRKTRANLGSVSIS